MVVMHVTNGKNYSSLFSDIQKAKSIMKTWKNFRPNTQLAYQYNSASDAAKIPVYRFLEEDIYNLAFQSDIVTTVTDALRKAVFRRGFEIKEKEDVAQNESEKELLKTIQKNANMNNQTLLEVLKQIEQDLNFMNNAYLLAIQDYVFIGKKVGDSKVKEIIRGHPLKMAIIADPQGRLGYNDDGERMFFSYTNRNKILKESEAKKTNFIDRDGHEFAVACYRGDLKSGEHIYYTKSEVLHITKDPTLLYGYSKLFPVWMKVRTLIEMDRYLMLAYQKQRSPRALLTVSTTNYESVRKAWEGLMAQTAKDPHKIHPMVIQTDGGKESVNYIDFMKPLTEMQYIETRNEMRRQIGAIYGVMPLFSGDLDNAGGLNNEGLQFSVTSQAAEDGQSPYNEKVFPWLLKNLGIETYDLILAEPEERDETEDIKRLGLKMDNAAKMKAMGFEVTFNSEEEEFTFSSETIEPTPNPFNQFGQNQNPGETSDSKPQSNAGEPEKGFDLEKHIEGEVNKVFDEFLENDNFKQYISTELFNKTFEGMDKQLSEDVKKTVLDAFTERKSLTDTIEKIKELGVDKSQAEIIARTERQGLTNKAREFRYREDKKSLFKWIGPSDERTTGCCDNIEKRTKKGVSLETLKQIVEEESEKDGFNFKGWTPHPYCRHTFIKIS